MGQSDLSKRDQNNFLTIFTPTYNRRLMLKSAYESLCKQTNKNFEWLIIDDGSMDDTYKVINEWLKDSDFKIRYYYQKNGGKHRAINKAAWLSKEKYMLVLDSDDILTEDAVYKIQCWCSQIEALSEYNQFAGVAGLRKTSDNQIIGGAGKSKEYIDATNLERKKYNLMGDKAEVYRVDILRKYPFKEFKGETFLTEETVWNRIAADGYKIRWHMEPIYLCEYHADGLTRNLVDLQRRNPNGFAYSVKEGIRLKDFRGKIQSVTEYWNVMKSDMSVKEICDKIDISRLKLFSFLIIGEAYLLLSHKR